MSDPGMRQTGQPATGIKLIDVTRLRPGMYIHDLNCGWLDHPFVSGSFMVEDLATVERILRMGIHELYIDTRKGLDVAHAPTQEEIRHEIADELAAISRSGPPPARASRAEETERARRIHSEASRIVRDIIQDQRLGRQIEVERIEPLVESMVDSIFRNADAIMPLVRLKRHDNYTFQHSVSVCALLIAFSRELDLPRDTIREIAIGGLLHDVGKAAVPDQVLNKPGKLDHGEFDVMRGHVGAGIAALRNVVGIGPIALDMVGQHHERCDGSGYPRGLRGDEISLYGRMGAIVDVYDAITSDRVYHRAMPPTEALGKLLEWSKYHFDAELTRRFIRSIGIYPTGSLVRLESGRLGVVVEQNPNKPLQPKVRVFYNAKRRYYLPPEEMDLARGRDRVEGYECFADWGFDPARWLGT